MGGIQSTAFFECELECVVTDESSVFIWNGKQKKLTENSPIAEP